MELFRKATALPEGEASSAGELTDEDREILSKRHLDFADRHASAQTIAELAATLADRYPKYGKKVQSRKRAAPSAAAEEPDAKKAASDGTPTQDPAAVAVANGSAAATAVDPGTAAATSTAEGEACVHCTYSQCHGSHSLASADLVPVVPNCAVYVVSVQPAIQSLSPTNLLADPILPFFWTFQNLTHADLTLPHPRHEYEKSLRGRLATPLHRAS